MITEDVLELIYEPQNESSPEGWQLVKLGDVCNRVGNTYEPKKDGKTPYVGLEHIIPGRPFVTIHGFESEVLSTKTTFKEGQILYGKLRPYLDKAGIANFKGVCSTDVLVLDSNSRTINEFLIYLLHDQTFIDYAKSTTTGVQHPRTSWNSLKHFKVYLPPLPEQRAIARVLSVVQAAIAKQDELIQTTQALKKTLMHKLFTEGIYGELTKETEIGPVPVSWEVVELTPYVQEMNYGTSVKCGYESTEDKVPVLRIPNVVNGYIDTSDMKFGPIKKGEDKKLLRAGDILFVRTNGVQENAGRCAVFNDELSNCYFASYLIRVRLKEQINPAFFNYYAQTETGKRYLSGRASRIADGKFNINTGTLRTVVLPKPKIEEQGKIVSVLDKVNSKLSSYSTRKQTLEAFFSTLLHELMTGQRRLVL